MDTLPLRDLSKLLHLARDLPRLLRHPLNRDQSVGIVRGRLASREQRFLRLVERAVYRHETSPYRKLLAAAGCELGDLRALVNAESLEGALEQLDRVGVYLTLEEFKGYAPVVRGSTRFTLDEGDLDNPDVYPHVEAQSGGTRGSGTAVKMSLSYFRDLAASTALAFEAHRLWEHDHVVWLQGFTPGFIYAALGRSVAAWFYPVGPLPARWTLASWYMTLVSQLAGQPFPAPRLLPVEEPARLVRWLVARRHSGRPVCVTSYASSAVRTCLAASAAGQRLDGVCFITLGEPFTESKRRAIERVGARALVRYAFTEAGIIGYACTAPGESDDLHFLEDSYGLVVRRRLLGQCGLDVDALRYTSLLPTAPKILLNVESGDTAQIRTGDCDCALGAVGLRRHLSGIRSFEKLSSEGMTFIQTDLLHVLEDVLPGRFGGTSADYQVLETEGEHGFLRLTIVVSPRIGPIDETLLEQTFLHGLAGRSGSGRVGSEVRGRSGTIEVRRSEPLATRAGKILPFHLAEASAFLRGPETPVRRGDGLRAP